MTRYSLRWRLLVGAAVAVFAALALAWLAMTLLFQRHLELRVEQELRRDALQLVAGLTVNPAGMITIQQLPTDPRLSIPAGGLYWQVSTGAADAAIALALGPGAWRRRPMPTHWNGARARPMVRSASDCSCSSGSSSPWVRWSVCSCSLRSMRTSSQSPANEFSQTLALFLLLLWAVLAGAAWIQVELGLKPAQSGCGTNCRPCATTRRNG